MIYDNLTENETEVFGSLCRELSHPNDVHKDTLQDLARKGKIFWDGEVYLVTWVQLELWNRWRASYQDHSITGRDRCAPPEKTVRERYVCISLG